MKSLKVSEEEKCKQIFDFYDIQSNGEIFLSQLGKILRSLGCILSEKDLDQIIEDIEAGGNETLSFTLFCQLFQKYKSKKMDEEQVKESLRVFQKYGQEDVVVQDNLKHVMISLGGKEALTMEEITKFLSISESSEGILKVDDLASKLISHK